MMEENIIKAAQKVGLDEETTKIFVIFFSKRFPNESDQITSYVTEWAERFKQGNPEGRMDSQSLEIYDDAIAERIKSW